MSKAILVKDEKHYDKFDRAFEIYFKGIETLEDIFQALIISIDFQLIPGEQNHSK